MEQRIELDTYIKFGFWDAVKILFGCPVTVHTTVIVPQENEIETYNANSYTYLNPPPPGVFVKQDRKPFGYAYQSPAES